MKITRNILFFISLVFSQFVFADKASDVADFKKEYAAYQTHADASQWTLSLPHAKKSFELSEKLFGDDSKNTSALAYNYGLNLLELREYKEAKKILKVAVGIYKIAYSDESKELVPVLMDLANTEAILTDYGQQKKYYKQALKITKAVYGKDSVNYGQQSLKVGIGLMDKAQSKEAKQYLYDAYEVLQKQLGASALRVGVAAYNVGRYELAVNNFEDSIVYFNKTLAIFERPNEPSNSVELKTHAFLVEAYQSLNRQDEATQHCLAIGEMTPFTTTQAYKPLVRSLPSYPSNALRKEREGYVIVEYDVDAEGFVIDPKVVKLDKPSSKIFSESAIAAAKKFRYAPRFENGKAVLTSGVMNMFTYELGD